MEITVGEIKAILAKAVEDDNYPMFKIVDGHKVVISFDAYEPCDHCDGEGHVDDIDGVLHECSNYENHVDIIDNETQVIKVEKEFVIGEL